MNFLREAKRIHSFNLYAWTWGVNDAHALLACGCSDTPLFLPVFLTAGLMAYGQFNV